MWRANSCDLTCGGAGGGAEGMFLVLHQNEC